MFYLTFFHEVINNIEIIVKATVIIQIQKFIYFLQIPCKLIFNLSGNFVIEMLASRVPKLDIPLDFHVVFSIKQNIHIIWIFLLN